MSSLQALNVFVNSPIDNQMIQCLVNSTLKVLPNCAQDSYPSPPSSPTSAASSQLPSLYTFITRLVKYTNVFTGTLMATLVYLKKLNEKLPRGATAQDPSSRHRIFLACLILSAKFHNDASPKNKHWARYTDGLFQTKEINEMERQLLFLLDWDITVSNQDLIFVLKDFLVPIKQEIKNVLRLKNFLAQQKQMQGQNTGEPSRSRSNSGSAPSVPVAPAFNKKPFHMSGSRSLPRINTKVPRASEPAAASAPASGPRRQLRKFPSLPQISANASQQSSHHIPNVPQSLPPLPPLPNKQQTRKPINYSSVQYVRSLNNSISNSSSSSANIATKSSSNLQSLHESSSSARLTHSNSISSTSSCSTMSSVSSLSSETFGSLSSSSSFSSIASSPEDDFFLQSSARPFNLQPTQLINNSSSGVTSPIDSKGYSQMQPRKLSKPVYGSFPVINEYHTSNYV